MKIKHVHGNFKIFIIKFFSKLLSRILFLFFKIVCPNVDYKSNDILISRATFAPWMVDKNYLAYANKVKKLTLLDHPRLFSFYYLSNQIKNIEADILDIGCMEGGVGLLLSQNNKKGRTLLFDTFNGFLDKENLHKGEVFKYDGLKDVNTTIIKLKLHNTDVNTYKSTKNCFNFVKDKIIKNGFIIFDDYGIYGVENVTKLINRITKKEGKNFNIFFNYFGQCILVKK